MPNESNDFEARIAIEGFNLEETILTVENTLPMQSYAELRAFTGDASGVRLIAPNPAGFFRQDPADTTSTDNGGTIIVDADGRRWKRLFSGPASVRWFLDEAIDDRAAIQACLDAHDHIWIPDGQYLLTAGVHADRLVVIDGDPGATLMAAPGFTGLSITKKGVPFILKALVSVFAGTDINDQGNPRLGEAGRSVKIGPIQLDCAGNADYGLLVNSCPGIQIRCHVSAANSFGIWAGPNCWGGAAYNPRLTRCGEGGIYFGEACNGASISNPEIWGQTIKTGVGVYLEGTDAGSIGAIGNVKIDGGYIEDCVYGVLLKRTGSATLLAVDIESIEENAVRAECSPGGTYGQINAIGCQLISLGAAFFNRNAYINVQGCSISDGAVLEPYYSDSPFSLFRIDGTLQQLSDGTPTAFPDLSSSRTVLANYETRYQAVTINHRLTNPDEPYSRSWALFNRASEDQPTLFSTGLEFRNSRWGGPTADYRGSFYIFANVTSSDPAPKYGAAAGLLLEYSGPPGLEIASFRPEKDSEILLGNEDSRWAALHATTTHSTTIHATAIHSTAVSANEYHAIDAGGASFKGVDGSFTSQDGKIVTVRGGIITAITP